MDSLKTSSVDWSLVQSAFKSLLARKEGDLPEDVETDLDKILAGTEGDLEKQRAYAIRLGTSLASAPQGHNGKHFDLDDVRPNPPFIPPSQMRFSDANSWMI